MGIPLEWGFTKQITRNVILACLVVFGLTIYFLYNELKASYELCDKKEAAMKKELQDCNQERIQDNNNYRKEQARLYDYFDSLYRSDIKKASKKLGRFKNN